MPPTSIGTIVIFFLFIAPGLIYERMHATTAKRAGRKPLRPAEDPLRSLGRLILASSLFTLASAMMFLAIRIVLPRFARFIVDPDAWQRGGHVYLDANPGLFFETALIVVVFAFVLASLVGISMGAGYISADEEPETWLPNLTRPYAIIQLKSGIIYSGFVRGYKRQASIGDRLVLASPITVKTNDVSLTLDGWSSIVLPASEIANLSLADALDDATLIAEPLLPQNQLYLYSDVQRPPWLPQSLQSSSKGRSTA